MKDEYKDWCEGQSQMLGKLHEKLQHLGYVVEWIDSRKRKSDNDLRLGAKPDNYVESPLPPAAESQRAILHEFLGLYQLEIPYKDLVAISHLHEVFSELERPPPGMIRSEEEPDVPMLDMGDPSNGGLS